MVKQGGNGARRKKGSGLGAFVVLVIIAGAAVFGYHAVNDEMKQKPNSATGIDHRLNDPKDPVSPPTPPPKVDP